MANRTVYVDGTTSGTPGTDGAHYASLQACITGEVAAAPNLVTSSAILNIECSVFAGDAADTTACTVNGFTTDSTHYVYIYTAAASRHDGKWNAVKYRLSVANAVALTITDDYVWIDGLQIEVSAANAASQHALTNSLIAATNNWLQVSNSILRSHTDTGQTVSVVSISDPDTNLKMWNCVLHHRAGTADGANRGLSSGGTACELFNLTIYGGHTGVRHTAGTSVATNVVAAGSSTTDFSITGGTLDRTYCVSEDATVGAGTGNQGSITLASMAFTDAANTDFHIASGSSLEDQGTDLTAEGYTTDIDGATRSGTWDIGADEWTSPSGTALSVGHIGEAVVGGSLF